MSRFISLIKLSSAAAFARTSHYSNLNFTYEEDYNSFSTTQKKNSWIFNNYPAKSRGISSET